MTTLDLPLRAPGGEPVDLWRTLVSHGFAELSPTHLDEEHRTLAFTVRVPGGRPRRVRISEGARRTARLGVLGPPPGPKVVRAVLHGAAHVLRLDQDLSPFYLLTEGDPRPRVGRHGRGTDAPLSDGLRGRREDGLHHELRMERDRAYGRCPRHQPR